MSQYCGKSKAVLAKFALFVQFLRGKSGLSDQKSGGFLRQGLGWTSHEQSAEQGAAAIVLEQFGESAVAPGDRLIMEVAQPVVRQQRFQLSASAFCRRLNTGVGIGIEVPLYEIV